MKMRLLTVLVFVISSLLTSCASSDRALDRIDLALNSNTSKDLKQFDLQRYLSILGKPTSRKTVNIQGDYGEYLGQDEELIWLMSENGDTLSEEESLGWELVTIFDLKGSLKERRWGTYRTTLSLEQILKESQAYIRDSTISREQVFQRLGLDWKQHGLEQEKDLLVQNMSDRARTLVHLHGALAILKNAMVTASIPLTKTENRLANEKEVLQYMIASSKYKDFAPILLSDYPLSNLAIEVERRNPRSNWAKTIQGLRSRHHY